MLSRGKPSFFHQVLNRYLWNIQMQGHESNRQIVADLITFCYLAKYSCNCFRINLLILSKLLRFDDNHELADKS